jgi:transposase
MTIGIDLGDVWSHYCTLNQDGEVVDRGRFRTTPKAIEKWFTDVPQRGLRWRPERSLDLDQRTA